MFVRISSIFLLLTALFACSQPPYKNLDNTQLQSLIEQGVPVFDIRRADEWRQTGVIEGSRLLTFVDGGGRLLPDFLSDFSKAVGPDEPVILICRTGNRTRTLARHLTEQMGYTHVYNVRNGITEWIGDGNAVTRLFTKEQG